MFSPTQLAPALHRQKKLRGFLGNHLLDLGLMNPEELALFVTPYPPLPETFEEIGLPENLLADLFLKHAFFRYNFSTREMAEALKIHQDDLLGSREAWQFIYKQWVRIRQYWPTVDEVEVEMLGPGRFQGGVWWVDAKDLIR